MEPISISPEVRAEYAQAYGDENKAEIMAGQLETLANEMAVQAGKMQERLTVKRIAVRGGNRIQARFILESGGEISLNATTGGTLEYTATQGTGLTGTDVEVWQNIVRRAATAMGWDCDERAAGIYCHRPAGRELF